MFTDEGALLVTYIFTKAMDYPVKLIFKHLFNYNLMDVFVV